MNCSCNGGHDDKVWWFSPNGSRLHDYCYTPNIKPYTTQTYGKMSSVLVIPHFSYTFAGTYACGIGTSFPPSVMAVTELSKCVCTYVCNVMHNSLQFFLQGLTCPFNNVQ